MTKIERIDLWRREWYGNSEGWTAFPGARITYDDGREVELDMWPGALDPEQYDEIDRIDPNFLQKRDPNAPVPRLLSY